MTPFVAVGSLRETHQSFSDLDWDHFFRYVVILGHTKCKRSHQMKQTAPREETDLIAIKLEAGLDEGVPK